jgi:3-hydroxybutyryl-CoA dehydrogenase
MRKLDDIRKVAVIGSGMMGTGCAMVFAGAGYQVTLYDVVPEALPKVGPNMRADLTFLAERGLGKLEDVEATLARVSTTLDLEEAVGDADFVLEAAVENMALKQEIFANLDRICGPEAVLATNTSVMSPTEIASKSRRRERIIGTHWWNPPFLIPLVEVVQTGETAPWVIELTMDLHRAIGKHPVHARKDVPGFIANRLQHALWREAVSIVENGIADAATVDESLKYGPGLRLPVLAPLENADLVGLDLVLSIHDYVFPFLEDRHDASPLVRERVEKGELGFKTGGTGLQAWTPEQQKALRTNLLDYLCKAVRELNEREARETAPA